MTDFAILTPNEIEAMTGFKIATRQLAVLQDDSKKLTEWFASRIDARWAVRQVCKEILEERNDETF